MKKFMRGFMTFLCMIPIIQSVVFATDDGAAGEITAIVKGIVNFIAYCGYAIAMGMLAYIGIKYMLSSANDKANMKQGVINYLIGAFLIGGASLVATTIVGLAGGNTADEIVDTFN